MIIGAIEASARTNGQKVAEQRLAANVQLQRYLRLPAVAAKVTLADESPEQETQVKGGGRLLRFVHGRTIVVSPGSSS